MSKTFDCCNHPDLASFERISTHICNEMSGSIYIPIDDARFSLCDKCIIRLKSALDEYQYPNKEQTE